MRKLISFLVSLLIFFGGVGAATYYQFTLSTDVLYANGAKIDAPMYKLNGRNYLPLKTVADTLGADVSYNKGRIDLDNLTDLERVVKKVKDSCVMIYVYKDGKAVMRGSGFAYNGHIITAKHVTDAGDKYIVYTDDSIYGIEATKKAVETDLDVSVLTVPIEIPSVTLGDSDRLIEGQELVAITSPDGMKNSVDGCLYSGKGYNKGGYYVDISETEIVGGSSGGAVFNMLSNFIGMMVVGSNGQGEAIPVNDLKPIFEKLK